MMHVLVWIRATSTTATARRRNSVGTRGRHDVRSKGRRVRVGDVQSHVLLLLMLLLLMLLVHCALRELEVVVLLAISVGLQPLVASAATGQERRVLRWWRRSIRSAVLWRHTWAFHRVMLLLLLWHCVRLRRRAHEHTQRICTVSLMLLLLLMRLLVMRVKSDVAHGHLLLLLLLVRGGGIVMAIAATATVAVRIRGGACGLRLEVLLLLLLLVRRKVKLELPVLCLRWHLLLLLLATVVECTADRVLVRVVGLGTTPRKPIHPAIQSMVHNRQMEARQHAFSQSLNQPSTPFPHSRRKRHQTLFHPSFLSPHRHQQTQMLSGRKDTLWGGSMSIS